MEPKKNLKEYIREVQEREAAKAMSNEGLRLLKRVIENEQIRRAVAERIKQLADTLQ